MASFTEGLTTFYVNGEIYALVGIHRDENGKVVSVEGRPVARTINFPIEATTGVDWSFLDNVCQVKGCLCKSNRPIVHALWCGCPECKEIL